MAEKRFIKGLFKDTGHIDQPEGTWRHARNMVMNYKDGAVSNEGGTILNGHLGNNSIRGAQEDKVIGAIEVDSDRVVLFVLNVVESLSATGKPPRSEIGLWENGTYYPIFNPSLGTAADPVRYITNDLGFNQEYPIEGTFKIDSKGDLLVYWTDDLNPPRAFNIDRQLRESGNGSLTGVNVNMLYGLGAAQIQHIDILNLFPYSGSIPHINIDDQGTHQNCVIEGGGLLTGVYYLALAYVDDDLVSTNYLTVSNPIPIVDEFDHTTPTNKKDGAREGSQTTKAIKWEISNLNKNYKYLRPIIIRSKGDAQEAFKLNDQIFTGSTTTVIYSGLETQASGSPSEVIIDTISYDTAKTIQQLDNVLYLGNTTSSKDLGYQKYANNIKLTSRVDKIENFDTFYASLDNLETGWGSIPVNSFGLDANGDPDVQTDVDPTKSYRYVPNIFKYKGYMRDEIYAFYIAFIMKDGSMSYAYHIPGRETVFQREKARPTDLSINYGSLWPDIETVSPEFGYLFHWMDASTWNISQGSYAANASDHRFMNYWENATEFYPDTDNYDVWDAHADSSSGKIGSLQLTNVRHHHFPSNRNADRKSIMGDNLCRTTKTAGSHTGIPMWKGSLIMLHKWQGKHDIWYGCCSASGWKKNRFNSNPQTMKTICSSQCTVADNDPAMEAALHDNDRTFTADQEMQVRVKWKVVHRQSGSNDPSQDVCSRLRVMQSSTTTTWNDDCDGHPIKWTGCGQGSGGPNDCNGSGTTGQNWVGWNGQGWSSWKTLNAGDQIWLESRKESSADSSMYQCGYGWYANGCMDPYGFSYMHFDIKAAAGMIEDKDLHDAKINHNVRRLGFDLHDIKIPHTYKDKIQGFRIYYANKKYSDRTVLGQSVLIPAMYKKEVLGLCEEAATNVDEASQILGTLQANPEEFYNMDAWARYWGSYGEYDYDSENGGPSGPVDANKFGHAMNVFSFHDFSLLKSKNSLAPATHIDILYYTRNLVWNGPGLDQDKKMVTTLSAGATSSDPLKVKEVWNWDAEQNCYPQKMKTAIFMGVDYAPPASRTQPRLLGQKAKTYLLGDTIFKGSNLGFGGKLFNEFGESCIAFRLMDGHAIGAYKVRSAPASNGIGYFADTYGVGSQEAIDWNHYGHPHGGYSTLLTTLDSNGVFTGTTGPHGWHGQRSQQAMVNLKAFKTDVYKSIDSQELVWTGFEVLEDDLDNFIFDEDGAPIDSSTDFKTLTTHPEGIYGGDTFICRYGFTATLKPSNTNQTAEPEKGIHFHIVESTDNINFRHLEDDNSLYFPGSISKDLLREAGQKDLSHFDNLKYNKNYSEVNNIRPAFPLPVRDVIQDDFPTRTHRSTKHDTTSIIDNYRVFLANQFRDLPKNRGELWKLASFSNLLYFHMEESLFAAQGKQTMEMKDGSEAFVGSGDIFAQEPNELVQTEGGFGGTQSQWASLTTRYGYFFVDASSKKVFMMKDSLLEISNLGMGDWFRDNLKFELESYNFSAKCGLDNPINGFGFHAIYDPKFKRILLTKRELVPTQKFIDGWNATAITQPCSSYAYGVIQFFEEECVYKEWGLLKNGLCGWRTIPFTCHGGASSYFSCGGWTISYYPELGAWGSFHDYVPYIYFNTSTDFYSLTDQYPRPVWVQGTTDVNTHRGTTFGNAGIWKHNSKEAHGIQYQEWRPHAQNITLPEWESIATYYPFEFEYIHNEFKAESTLTSSINYTLETFNQENISVLEHGFTSFFVYNTFQISGIGQDWQNILGNPQADANGTILTAANISSLNYLINTRRTGGNWKINHFRDMAAIAVNTNPYYMQAGANVTGGTNVGTTTTSNINKMFIEEGMNKIVNASFINFAKNWNLQKKFIDKWVGIRLIYNNISNNSLNLYSTNVGVRKTYR